MKPAYTYRATVARVIDGDTVDLVIDLGFKMTTEQRIRLARINTPEKGQSGCTEATAKLMAMLPTGTAVMVTTAKSDLYGRYIGEIHANGIPDVGQVMLDCGLAKAYVPRP